MADRGVIVDHATLNRWVEKYSGAIAEKAQRSKTRGVGHGVWMRPTSK